MKYIFILGINYRDCKAKLAEIVPAQGTVYPFVTKPKHVQGIPSSGVIETPNAKQNPFYRDIMGAISGEVATPQPIPAPVIEEPIPPLVEVDSEPVDALPVEVPIANHIDELIEEPVLEEEVVLDEEVVLEEEVIEMVVEEEPAVEEEVEEEPVLEEEVIVIDEEPVVEVEEEVVVIKPLNPPRGWHARAEFIDVNGNIFKKGKYSGHIND